MSWSGGSPAGLAAALLAASVYLGAHPYWGIAHDAKLYVGQALQRSGLADLSADLFFAFGSQDRFTGYSAILGYSIGRIGIGWSALIATLLGVVAMLVATHRLVRSLGWGAAALPATVFVAALPGTYSALGIPLVEPYATPRPLACALVLLAVATAAEGRRALPIGFLLIATLLHPLMALPGVAWVALASTPGRTAFALLLTGGVGVVALALADISPFDQLLTRIDDSWQLLLEDRAPYLYLLRWEDPAWSGYSGMAAMIAMATFLVAARMEGVTRRFFIAGGVVAIAGAIATFLGGDLMRVALVVQLQPWRALWIAAFLTLVGGGILLTKVIATRNVEDSVALMGVSAGLMLQSSASPIPVALAGALLIALRLRSDARLRRWAMVAMGSVLLMAVTWCLLERPNLMVARSIGPDATSAWPLALRDPFLWLVIGLLVAWSMAKWRARTLLCSLVLSTFSILALGLWDWQRSMHTGFAKAQANTAELVATLPTGGSVYWSGNTTIPWFELRYPSYVSQIQTAGIVFNRSTAIEAARRTRGVFAAAGDADANQDVLLRRELPRLDLAGARRLCEDNALAAVYVESLNDQDAGPVVLDWRGHRRGTLALCERIGRG